MKAELATNGQFVALRRGGRKHDKARLEACLSTRDIKQYCGQVLDFCAQHGAIVIFANCQTLIFFVCMPFKKKKLSLEILHFANKLTEENLTNLTNLAAWLVFAWVACLGEIIFPTQSRSVWCAHYSHAQRSQSSRSLLLSSDVLIHPVPSTQTSHHTALFVPPAFSSISPLLVTFCHHYIACLYDFILCTQAFALPHTQCLQSIAFNRWDSVGSPAALLAPFFYAHIRRCLPFWSPIIIWVLF